VKRLTSLCALLLMLCISAVAKNYTVVSPDGRLKALVEVGKTISYQVTFNGQQLLAPSQISMTVSDGDQWGIGSKLKGATTTKRNASIKAQNYKKAVVKDCCNELTLAFKGFSLVFRAYNEGVAYRFVSGSMKSVKIAAEQADMNYSADFETLVPYVIQEGSITQQFHNSFENSYTPARLSELRDGQLIFLPYIVKAENGVKVVVSESDVENYPGMFVKKGSKENGLDAVFAPYPKTVKQGGHNELEQFVTEAEDYITVAKPNQKFPWRIISVSAEDKNILDNDMVFRLASPSRLADASWVKPGKVAWDWWNDWGLYKVPFKAGINTETYKYYIDFAAKHSIEYVILDEGWAVNKKADLFQVVPEIDLKAIVDYGKQKGVDIILWAGYKAFDRDMEKVCKTYSEMGVKGYKVDFINRNDAEVTNFMYKAAEICAKYKQVLDFHGICPPTGLTRTWPNVINFEGVNGQEQNKWATIKNYNQVQYDVIVPFARNFAGPMDYTQGAMLNGTRSTYRPSNSEPMSQGTRCHQLAEYVVFLSPLNMLCDSPTHYEEEPECTDFIAKIPTVWDETVALKSEVGEYVAVARRSGSKWLVGAVTNWTPRDLTLDLTPLKVAGKTATVFKDGLNADRFAQDYEKTTITVPADGKVTMHLAPGGGVALEM
jgi:alpha-glucosidase